MPYSGKLSREKTFTNFAVLWLFVKVFSMKLGAWDSWRGTSEQSDRIFHQSAKVFSLESFPLYGISSAYDDMHCDMYIDHALEGMEISNLQLFETEEILLNLSNLLLFFFFFF